MSRRELKKRIERLRAESAKALEAQEQQLSREKTVALERQGRGDGVHVLICDDQKLNGDLVRIFLNKRDIPSDYAKNGLEALGMFSSSSVGYYSTILMDVHMPVMDGLKATETIRELDRSDAKTVNIVAMTADASAEDTRRCLSAGMNSLISKPVDQSELFRKVL